MITKEQEEKLKKIYDHFGEKIQFEKLKEECRELIVAIECLEGAFETENREAHYNNIREEIADVKNVIEQFEIVDTRGRVETSIEKWKEIKINRTLERIKEGYYDEQKL